MGTGVSHKRIATGKQSFVSRKPLEVASQLHALQVVRLKAAQRLRFRHHLMTQQ